jgi:lysyl-tRNA synthetase class 2
MDYGELMNFVQGMLVEGIEAAGLDPKAVPFQGEVLDFKTPLPRVTFHDLFKQHAKLDLKKITDREAAKKAALKLKIPVEKTDGHATIIDKIYKNLVRPKIVQPIYITDYPAEITPLAKRKADDPNSLEMFQLVYGHGVENVKAFSELNDPIDQELRFKEQEAARAKGDEEAQFGDPDFVTALKYGLPPTAGFGIGIDRFAATLADVNTLKEVILFPTLRPEKPEDV